MRNGIYLWAVFCGLVITGCLFKITPRPYTNYYIPLNRGLVEYGNSGEIRHTPRIFVENNFLYIRSQSFDYDSDKDARADAYNDMLLIVDKVTNKSGKGPQADKVEEKFIYVRDMLEQKRIVVEAIYALPISILDAQIQAYLAEEYGFHVTVTKSIRIDSLRLRLKQLTGTMYTNPSMKDSVKIVKFTQGVLDNRPGVFTEIDSVKKEGFLCIKGYSTLCPSPERAEHNATYFMDAKVKELAGKQEVVQVITGNTVLMEVVDVLGTEGYLMEIVYKLPLKQFPAEVQNRLKLNH